MPNPREAVYDVLLSKKVRTDEQRRNRRCEEEWERYEEDNARANAAYQPKGR